MTTAMFLAEWAVRSSALIACGALLMWALRLKDASVRLAAWTAMLAGSVAIPVLTIVFPKVPVAVMNAVNAPPIETFHALQPLSSAAALPRHFDWWGVVLAFYAFTALVLLLRLCIGLVLSLRLLRGCRETGRTAEGVAVLESDAVTAPVTLGIVRPRIVLPRDWREWGEPKLNAVLAHERSHIRRRDPAVQLLAAIHRAILWHSPMSWFLHRSMLRSAEEACDDAAIAATQDRASYAEVLLEFMRRGTRRAAWLGVPMARYGRVERRIHRILDGTGLSRGITRRSMTAIVACALPLVYVAANARLSRAAPQAPAAPPPPRVPSAPTPAAPPRRQAGAPSAEYLTGLGTVTPAWTINVRSRIDGELKSLGFEEGKPVEAGQLLATIESQDRQSLLKSAQRGSAPDPRIQRAQEDLAQDRARLAQSAGKSEDYIRQLESQVKTDEQKVEDLDHALAYGEVRAPFAGVAGLRKIDPGNLVHAGDLIVVITQVQPIAVLFNIPEDNLPKVMGLFRAGDAPTVEAWNRDATVKLSTGKLTAVDNEIDKDTGTALLKATFDNKDGALYPNQFVNARIFLNGR